MYTLITFKQYKKMKYTLHTFKQIIKIIKVAQSLLST